MNNEEMIREALACFSLDGAETEIIRHNEKLTLRASSDGASYVVSVYSSVGGFDLALLRGDMDAYSLLDGEMSHTLRSQLGRGYNGSEAPENG
ncbi:MAG: hypothetical protein PHI27_12160 [Eubacteriales bacterium]|nr:hypothetical protein [Eubacteriales bacterium]